MRNFADFAGQYKLYAVQLPGLTDVVGFPVSIEGHNANNDPTRCVCVRYGSPVHNSFLLVTSSVEQFSIDLVW